MVEEIVYTSAEKGLKQGSRGFCTVVSTAGMSLALAERLESMSGYRHAFPLHDPQASMNPVCFSHVTTRLAGKTLHVISRVADAGQDYTGRSNKLAHHLVIDHVASMPAGPARLMVEPGVIVERWDGNVRNVPPRELRCAPLPASIPLVAWQSLTGDEGWAGSVAEQLLQNPAPVSIIFKPGTDTLTLVREVLDLIPAPQRWNVTFSTYFTRLLAGAECQLRFVLNDTPEATSLRNDARARVIDLTSSLPAATGGTLVAMARKGQLTPQEPAPTPAAPAVRARTAVEISTKDTGAEISIPKLKPGLSALETPDKPQPPRDLPPPVRVNIRKGVWIVLTLAMTVVTVTCVLVFVRPAKNDDPFADLMNKTLTPDRQRTDGELAATRAHEQAVKDLRKRQEIERLAKELANKAAKQKATDEQMAAAKLDAEKQAELEEKAAIAKREKEARDAALKEEGPFALIVNNKKLQDKYEQWLFNVPKPEPQKRYDAEPLQLRANGDEITLSLCEEANHLFAASSYQLQLKRDGTNLNEWIVEATQGTTVIPIAKYIVSDLSRDPSMNNEPDKELQFEWLRDASRETLASELLRWWPLTIKVGDRKAVLLQRTAEEPQTDEGRPTWESIVDSKEIEVINTNAIKAIGFDEHTNAQFTIEIEQPDEAPQKIDLLILPAPLAGTTGDVEAPSNKRTFEKYFHLRTPIKLIDDQPEVTEDLKGFGTFQLSLLTNSTKGLTLNPKLMLTLRLPKEENLKKLPDSTTIKGLKDIVKQPLKLAEWDSKLAEAAVSDIRSEKAESRNETENWHTQSLKVLKGKEAFQDNTFFNLSRNAIKKVRSAEAEALKQVQAAAANVRKLESVTQIDAKMRAEPQIPGAKLKLQEAQLSLEQAKANKPLIEPFTRAMSNMGQEIANTQQALLQDYDYIKQQVDDLLKDVMDVRIRCTLSGPVDLTNYDSGPKIVIYFLETTSPNWPADTTQQGAK